MYRNKWLTMLLYVASCGVQQLVAQGLGRSAYGQFGVGDVLTVGSARQMALSGTSTALTPSRLNMVHPALNGFNKGLVVFEGGLSGLRMWSLSPSARQIMYGGNISYLGVMVPISKKYYALSVGLNPYSNANSRFNTSRNFENANYVVVDRVDIKGGLNRIYMDHAIRIHKNLALGFGSGIVIGNIKRTFNTTLIFPDHNSSAILYISEAYRLIELKPSIAFTKNISESQSVTFVSSYSFGFNMASKVLATNTQSQFNPNASVFDTKYKDTIDLPIVNEPSALRLPGIFRGGITWEKANKLIIGTEIVYSDYTGFKSFELNNPYGNGLRWQTGIEYVPKYNAFRQYLKRIVYRAGGFMEKTPFLVQGKSLQSIGVSAGFGLPLGRQIVNMLDLSAELGKRGALGPGMVEETFFRFHIGLSINERWFQRYKMD